MKKLVLIDGHALLHRAYHGMPMLTTSRGELVNAVYGFSLILLRVLSEIKPTWVIATFDRSAPTFRHTQFTGYKAHRVAAPDDLHAQLPKVVEVLKTLNIPIFELDGYEADDLIGTIANQAASQKEVDEIIIVTGDMDATQLVNEKVKVYTARKGLTDTVLYDQQRVRERYSLEPSQVPDYKGLSGDASDNIPGVAGIGEVSAKKLLNEFGSVEGIYKNIDKISGRTQQLLIAGQEAAVMSKKLATIDIDAPIKIDLPSCVLRHYDKAGAIKIFNEFEFKSLIPKLPDSDFSTPEEAGVATDQVSLLSSVPVEKTPLQSLLLEMKATGVMVEREVLDDLSVNLNKQILELEQKVYQVVGHEFNLNSPKQVADVLFGELGLEAGAKKKTHPSTDSDTLTSLIDAHPVIEFLLSYRELFKLKSTYIDAIPNSIGSDGRIHTDWHDDIARTGRLSSANPNLQNIPARGDWGTKIRRAFVAPKGSVLLSADYNQIELRVMAHLSGDPELTAVFKENKDIHTTTAAWIFGKKESEVDKDDRRVAKTVNFGVLYLMSPFGLSRALRIDPKIAAEFIDRYYNRFSGVKEYQEKILKAANEDGYLETISGFKRYFGELRSNNYQLRQAGERMASNFPVQGSAADIIKKAMLDIDANLKIQSLKSKVILQVHDELVLEVPKGELEEVTALVKAEMESGFVLSVPLPVDLKSGPNWADMADLKVS